MADTELTSLNPRIIALGYRARSGKDTIGIYLTKHYGYQRVAFADPIKAGLVNVFRMHPDSVFSGKDRPCAKINGHRPREFMQRFGRAMRREFGADVFVEIAKDAIISKLNLGYNVVVTDVRLLREVNMLKDIGADIWKVDRQQAIDRIDGNKTEHELDTFTGWTTVIPNNTSLPDLCSEIEKRL